MSGIGDLNSNKKGTAARYNADKPQLSYIPMETLYGECAVWAFGEKKYSKHNWKKGMPWMAAFDSLQRHLIAWQGGEEADPESGLSHLAHASANLRMLLYFTMYHPELDDRFKDKSVWAKRE